ncbi:hypothetical protein ACFYY8_34350 [Streptosporangium sp. NPDC001559]|uniref:hypothetical protein n=1 Tax=Streptosporangium sp. NPDC001559 TaxID=3366187 RepID=UPI0036EF17C4
MQDHHDIRQDVRATIEARRDLGPEYEAALVESFVERLDSTIAARVRAELQATGHHPQHYPHPQGPHPVPRRKGNSTVPIALGSLGLAIPLTAVAAEGGTVGILVAWGGIVVINIAHALGGLRHRD